MRYATTAYSLHNSSIQAVIPSSKISTPFLYPAEDIFTVLQYAFNSHSVQEGDISFAMNVSDAFLERIAATIQENSFLGITSADEYDLLRNLLALPLYFVNVPFTKASNLSASGQIPSANRVKGYLATDSFRLVISIYTLYTFTTLALITLSWCAIVWAFCWFRGGNTPNISLYPEIDFAAKIRNADVSMTEILNGLGNGNRLRVEKNIVGTRVFVSGNGVRNIIDNADETKAIIMTTIKTGHSLEAGRKYL